MHNRKGFGKISAVAIAVALLFIIYGYYGYFYVPKKSSSGTFGNAPTCPIDRFMVPQSGFSGGFSQGGKPCAYSLYSFVIGIIVLILTVVVSLKFD